MLSRVCVWSVLLLMKAAICPPTGFLKRYESWIFVWDKEKVGERCGKQLQSSTCQSYSGNSFQCSQCDSFSYFPHFFIVKVFKSKLCRFMRIYEIASLGDPNKNDNPLQPSTRIDEWENQWHLSILHLLFGCFMRTSFAIQTAFSLVLVFIFLLRCLYTYCT